MLSDMLRGRGHYCTVRRAGEFLYTAGIVPRDAQRKILGESIEDQTRAVLTNLRSILREANADLSGVVKLQVYLSDLKNMARFNSVYEEMIGDDPPARSTIGCALNGVLIEIDAVVYLGRSQVNEEQ